MSQLIFAQAKAIRKQALAAKKRISDNEFCTKEQADLAYDISVNTARHEFKEILKIAALLHEDYVEVIGQTNNWYMITIRPDTSKCDFETFYEKVRKFSQRSFFKEYTLSFEQKGTSDDTLGNGFHVHIVADTTHRSKGECLRDSKSTFSGIAAENCIDVRTTKNPKDIIQQYLVEYESSDDHKKPTMEWDHKWRQNNNLENLYTNVSGVPIRAKPLSIKSGQTGAIIIDLSN